MQRTSLLSAAAILAALSIWLLIIPQRAHAQGESVLYSFCSGPGICSDGDSPSSQLIANGPGLFYGTTQSGGSGPGGNCFFGCSGGTVFEVFSEPASGCPSGTNSGSGWCQQVLYNFCINPNDNYPDCPDGASPTTNLLFVRTGSPYNPIYNLYGTTYNGGTGSNCQDPNGYGCGIVFDLTPVPLPQGVCPSGTNTGNGWCETVIYNFCSQANCADGSYPVSGLIRDSAGNLYGTNTNGVFELSPNGSGGWTESLIYADPNFPAGGLVRDAAGNLYGADAGSIFKLSADSGWAATNIHAFTGSPRDGAHPVGTPAIDSAGNVYGATYQGGSKNYGTVWKLTPVTTGKLAGTYREKILHSFTSVTTGDYPAAGVTLDSAGNVYGTTQVGGKYLTQCDNSSTGNPIGCGTVFKLAVSGENYTYKLLWSFNDTDGGFPYDNPVLDSSGNLYGTTYIGGIFNGGAVFEINPSAPTTTTTLTSSPNPSISGNTVTFTATVSSSSGTPPDGEIVNFMDGSTLLGSGTLSGGSATFTTSSLAVGASVVDAVYSGDLNFAPSTSKNVRQVVKP
jgi:hypothetical protein